MSIAHQEPGPSADGLAAIHAQSNSGFIQNHSAEHSALAPENIEILLAHPVFSLMQLLEFKPDGSELARALTLDYFSKWGAIKCRICIVDASNYMHFVGDFGYEISLAGSKISAEDRARRTDEITAITLDSDGVGWNFEKTSIGIRFTEKGVTRGFIVILFANPVTEWHEVSSLLRVLIRPTGFYVNSIVARSGATAPLQGPVAVTPSSFSKRQLQILKGMVDGKTNHDLARILGFSVSTIRHETMRIYQILAVSDRREAAREAMERELV